MRRLAFLALLLGALGTVGAVAGTSKAKKEIPVSGTVWAVERFDGGPNTLAAFDACTGACSHLPGRPAPDRRDRATRNRQGYTADERSNRLTIGSKNDLSVVDRIPVEPSPHHIMASPNGRFVYVGEYRTNEVRVVDTSIDERVAEYTASANPRAKTHAVWISDDGKDVYATNEGSAQTDTGTLSGSMRRRVSGYRRSRPAAAEQGLGDPESQDRVRLGAQRQRSQGL